MKTPDNVSAGQRIHLRCPYCSHRFPPPPHPRCPRCGKAMRVPESLQPRSFAERRRDRARVNRRAEAAALPTLAPDPRFGRGPRGVLIMLGILVLVGAALLATSRRDPVPSGRTDPLIRAAAETRIYRIATERFRRDCGRYPTAEEGLLALVRDPGAPGWAGPYVNLVKPDPWRTPFRYEWNENAPIIRSDGPDRLSGTEDDIRSDTLDSIESDDHRCDAGNGG